MVYKEFLLAMILSKSEYYKNMEFDLLFEEALNLWEQFEFSEFDKSEIGLYECLDNFVQSLNKE